LEAAMDAYADARAVWQMKLESEGILRVSDLDRLAQKYSFPAGFTDLVRQHSHGDAVAYDAKDKVIDFVTSQIWARAAEHMDRAKAIIK